MQGLFAGWWGSLRPRAATLEEGSPIHPMIQRPSTLMDWSLDNPKSGMQCEAHMKEVDHTTHLHPSSSNRRVQVPKQGLRTCKPYVHIYTYKHIQIWTYIPTCTFIPIDLYLRSYLYMLLWVCMGLCICIEENMYVYIYGYKHIYIEKSISIQM